MTTPTTQPDDRCDQIAREKYYQTGDTCPCCGIGTYLPSGVCGHCDIHRDSEYAAHRRSRILKHENQQPKSEDEVLRQLRQEVAPRIQALKESERNVFEQPKSEPSRECEQIAKDLIEPYVLPYYGPEESKLEDRVAKVLQAKQDEMNALREEVLGVIEPFVSSFMKGKKRYDKAQSDWFEKMPGEWPQDLTVKVQDCRAAKALRDKLKASQPTSPPPQTPHQ